MIQAGLCDQASQIIRGDTPRLEYANEVGETRSGMRESGRILPLTILALDHEIIE